MANGWRVKPLDAILATAERKSLHRSLGALQLTLFGVGCIIGTGIFADRRRRPEGRAGPDARLPDRGRRLRGGAALLCRDRRDGVGGGLGLHLHLFDDGRAARLDLGRGLVEAHEPENHDLEPSIPGIEEART